MDAPKPVGSEEWVKWFMKQPRPPETPRRIYVDNFEGKFEEKTSFQLWELFDDNEKEACDYSRILEIVHDCFEDETSIEECTQMIIEFCEAHKFLPKK